MKIDENTPLPVPRYILAKNYTCDLINCSGVDKCMLFFLLTSENCCVNNLFGVILGKPLRLYHSFILQWRPNG